MADVEADGAARAGAAQPWAQHWAALVLLSAGCARFGYELLPLPEQVPDGPRLSDGGGATSLDAGGDAAGEATVPDQDAAMAATVPPAVACADGVRGPGEQGVDCGGDACAPCACAFSTPELLGEPNYPGNNLYSPTLSPDGRELWFGLIILGFPEQVGRATRGDPSSPFGQGEVIGPPISTGVDGNPHLAADGLTLYFYSERSGTGAQELYSATRADAAQSFDTPTALDTLNGEGLDQLPWLSADQLSLYFVSDRGGDRDLWRAARALASNSFGLPEPMVELNSTSPEGKATLSSDLRQIVFSSDRPGGPGGTDLYVATRADAQLPFSTPVLLTALSSSAPEFDAEWTRDGQWLYFASTRDGIDSRLWRAAASCP